MKRYIALIVSAFLLCSVVSVAAHENGEGDSGMSEDVIAILREQMDASELEILKNKDYYWDRVPDDFSEYPMMRVYHGSIWEAAAWSPQEIKEYFNKQYSQKGYMVLYEGGRTFQVVVHEVDGGFAIVCTDNLRNTFLGEDVRNISRKMNILGTDCEILEMFMIDTATAWQGKALYLVSDKGTFVVYYPTATNAAGILWTEEEFRTYATAYRAYLQEHAYGPNGEPTGGDADMIAFLEQEYSDVQLVPFDVMQARRNVEESPAPNPFPFAAVAISAAVVVAAGAIAVVIFRKKRKAQ